jgi:hypothetical protein
VSQGREASGREGGPENGPLRSALRLPRKRLEAILDEALVDCYNESEETVGLYTMIEDNVGCPFTTSVLDVEVEVEKLDLTDAGEVVAVCRRGRSRQRVPILDLPLPDPPPKGWKWIEAYRCWARGSR